MMKSKVDNLPSEILGRELDRLEKDIDRLQMLVTLKSHLQNLELDSQMLQRFFSSFNDEKYCLQAIEQLIPSIYTSITPDSLNKLLELFRNQNHRFNVIETLKNCELLKNNPEVHEILLNEYRQYFHVKKPVKIPDSPPPIFTPVQNPSGVFEKAKQFVCRVFGGGSKRLMEEMHSPLDNPEQKKFQFEPTPIPSQSFTSLVTHHSSLPIVTQIHSILDNIDSVLDKIEAQSSLEPSTIDQITQTSLNLLEHHGNGDHTGEYLDSLMSSDSSDEDEEDED